MSPVVTYSLARLALFVLMLAIFAALGAGRLTAVVGAAVSSMLISYLALSRLRNQVAERVAGRIERRLAEKDRRRSAQGETEAE